MLARIAALGLALLAPHAASAAALAPAKASDLVTLYTKDQKATCPGGGKPFDSRVLPDGTDAPFAIPAKQVLVIQSVDWVIGSSAPGGVTVTPIVSLQTGPTEVHPILIGSGATNSDGGASGTVLAPPGVTVRAGPALCITGADFTSAVLHGFLAKDK